MERKIKVGVIGGTGMVGQLFISLLQNHPWFEVSLIAASSRSAGLPYGEAVKGRWFMQGEIPRNIANLKVKSALNVENISKEVEFVFSAISLSKEETAKLETEYAKREIPVISNNSAHRFTSDVPVIIPEINPHHIRAIESQKKRLKTKKGFIVAKPNCSIQSYVPAIHALRAFGPEKILVSTYQALSGAGKTLKTWPEMDDNIIPFIKGEEEKSEKEPMKIWGTILNGEIKEAKLPIISSQCLRVPVSNGHIATVFVSFAKKITKGMIITNWQHFKPNLSLPSSPEIFLKYFFEEDRPQTRLDRDLCNGMGISLGRLREDNLFDYKFVALSHNTIRGAAGGAILLAELLKKEGYI